MTALARPLTRYFTHHLGEWSAHTTDRWRTVDGTMVYVDISGFTALSEKLARRGRIGAEELTELLNRLFTEMIGLALARGGSLLKFGGDALLLLFEGEYHAVQACSAVVEMQGALRAASEYRSSAGRQRLRMSVGVHSGPVHLFRVGSSHHELLVTGPAASVTTRMEEAATAGQVMVSAATRALLPAMSADRRAGPGWLLGWRKPRGVPTARSARRDIDPAEQAACVPVALRDHLTQGDVESEHHLATVAFVKYTGVDQLMRSGGGEPTAQALHRLISSIQTIADDEGVAFLASDIDEDGGKVILVAGVPGVREDDAGRVLRASRRIIDEAADSTLDVKIGVNQGHVFAGAIGAEFRATYTIMGDTVNLAARLMGAASPGELYASPETLDGSATVFETVALVPMHVKGKSRPVHAKRVGKRSGRRSGAYENRLPFVGRATELARLEAVVHDLQQGRGNVLTVVGERGVGKTRLVDEINPLLGRTLRIELRAEPYGTATPYRPFRGPVRSLLGIERGDPERMAAQLHRRISNLAPDALPYLPLIGDVTMIPVPATPEVDSLDPQFRQARTADLLVDLLARGHDGPVFFRIEDASDMDEASTHGLTRLAAATADHPWLVVVTRRDAEGGFYPEGEAIRLGDLAADERRALVEAATEATPLRPHEIHSIVERAGGLPLFIEEMTRTIRATGGTESLPDSIEALVSAQIDALPPLARRLLRWCSVLGLSFWAESVGALLSEDDVGLDEATRASLGDFLVRDPTDRIAFRHGLIRDVAYEGLSFRRRRELHLRVATIAERAAAPHPEREADMLGLHFSLARHFDKAWAYARIAGDQAVQTYANVDATVHYRRALDAATRLDHVDADERADVWTGLGDAFDRAGRYDDAFDAYRRAGRLVKDESVRSAELRLRRAVTRRRSGRYTSALRELSAGIQLLADADGRAALEVQGRLAAERGAIRRWQQRPRDVLAAGERAEAFARSTGDLATLGRALDLIHWARRMTGDTRHQAPYAETLAIYESIGDLTNVALVWNNRGADAFYAGRWNDSIEAYRQSSDAARRAGNDVDAAISDANLAEVLVNQGRYDEAEPALRAALRVLQASNHAPAAAFVEGELARLMLRRGDRAEATELIVDIRDRAVEAGEALTNLNATLMLAEAELTERGPTTSLELIESAETEAGDLAELFGPTILRLRAQAMSRLGRSDEALELIGSGLDSARRQGLLFDEAQLLEARIDIRTGVGEAPDPSDIDAADRLRSELGIQRAPV